MRKAIIFIMLILVCLNCGCSNNDNVVIVPNKAEPKSISFAEFICKEEFFSLEVPEEWIQYKENNEYHFTEKYSGTDLYVYTEEYFPGINNYDQNFLTGIYRNAGKSLLSYIKNTGDSYSVMLSFKVNNTDMTEYQKVVWGYNRIYYIDYVSTSAKADKYIDVFNHACDTLRCTNEKYLHINDGYSCYYNEKNNLSIEYPMSWNYDGFESGFSVSNEITGSTITIDNIEGINDFDKLTQLQYLQMMQDTVPNISLVSFSNSGDKIIAESYFQQNNVEYNIHNILLNENNFVINITFVSSSVYKEYDYPYFEKMIGSVKVIKPNN